MMVDLLIKKALNAEVKLRHIFGKKWADGVLSSEERIQIFFHLLVFESEYNIN